MNIDRVSVQDQAAEKVRFRVWNRTEGTVVSPDVVAMDTTDETFTAVAKCLKEIASSGIWLQPYHGIPKVSWMPDMDIVYLDEHWQVLRCIESYRQSTMVLPEISASNAVVLPTGRLSAARIQFGDQLEFRDVATGVRIASPGSVEEDASERIETDKNAEDESGRQGKGLRNLFEALFHSRREEPKQESSDRRKGKRHVIPGSVAYFSIWGPRPFKVADISTEGFYVRTKDQWLPGTSLLVGLQIVNPASGEIEAMVSVQSKVVRLDSDGAGFAYDDEPMHSNPLRRSRTPR